MTSDPKTVWTAKVRKVQKLDSKVIYINNKTNLPSCTSGFSHFLLN